MSRVKTLLIVLLFMGIIAIVAAHRYTLDGVKADAAKQLKASNEKADQLQSDLNTVCDRQPRNCYDVEWQSQKQSDGQ